jgi:hypothetical protein
VPHWGSWGTMAAGAALGFFLASLAACSCACGGSFLGAICYWAQGRSPLIISNATSSSTTSADLDALAGQIYLGGPQGHALRAAARRLHSTDGDVWNWAARRARARSQTPEAARREDHCR